MQEDFDEDKKFHEQQCLDLQEDLYQEMALKKIVVEKERELLEKRETLEKLKQERERGNPLEDKMDIQINQFQRLCIQKLQERIQYLQERASKIKQELESVKNTQSDPKLLVQMEEILDLIHSNQVLE